MEVNTRVVLLELVITSVQGFPMPRCCEVLEVIGMCGALFNIARKPWRRMSTRQPSFCFGGLKPFQSSVSQKLSPFYILEEESSRSINSLVCLNATSGRSSKIMVVL